jgi:hypothetical protein
LLLTLSRAAHNACFRRPFCGTLRSFWSSTEASTSQWTSSSTRDEEKRLSMDLFPLPLNKRYYVHMGIRGSQGISAVDFDVFCVYI